MEDDSKRYSEREFALILRRAAELGSSPEGVVRRGSGFSLAEIKAIAADAGIDPALVEQAARLVPAERGQSALERVIGGPLRHSRDFRLPGELTEARAARLLSTIRAVTEQQGRGEAHATGLSWGSTNEPSRTFVSAQSEGGGTRVRIGVDRGGGLLLTTFLNVMGGLLAAAIAGAVLDPDSLAVGAGIVGGGVAAGLAGARSVWSATTRRIRDRLDTLVESIAGSVEETPASSSDSGERRGQ